MTPPRGGDRRSGAPVRPAPRRRPPLSELGGDAVEGRRAVLELLSVGRRTVRKVLMAQDQDPSPLLDQIEELAARMRVPVESVPRHRLDAEARTEAPQGVIAQARPIEPVALEDLCVPDRKGVPPFLLVAAGITDPRNLGALLRSAECAGVTGVVLPRSAGRRGGSYRGIRRRRVDRPGDRRGAVQDPRPDRPGEHGAASTSRTIATSRPTSC